MPVYQYACTDCGHTFEERQSFSDDALTVCPTCGGHLRKVFNSVGVVFKGSGFYSTDSRSGSSSSSPAGSTSSDTGSTSSGEKGSASKDSGPSSSAKDSGASNSSTTSAKPAKPASGGSSS